MITKSKIFEVYQEGNKLFTINLAPGRRVYDERLIKENGIEYREWNPLKSKLAAMILKGSPNVGIRKNDVILYLGAASGTTVSHVSDIVGKEGFIFALDFAPRVVRDLVFVCEDRRNMAPLLESKEEQIKAKEEQIKLLKRENEKLDKEVGRLEKHCDVMVSQEKKAVNQ